MSYLTSLQLDLLPLHDGFEMSFHCNDLYDMHQVFYDSTLQAQFESEGYATLPLLNEQEIRDLQHAYNQLDHLNLNGFHCSMFNTDVAYRQQVDQIIKDAVGHKLDDQLVDYRNLFANFMVKEPDEGSDWFVHQDWAYVDESQYTSIALWFPLTNVDTSNGALHVVPGSHKIENKVRGPGAPNPYDSLHEEIREKYSKMVPLQAGEAIIWHHRLLHFSPPNRSNEARIAATIIMVPSTAKVFHHWSETNETKQQMERFEVDTDFFMNYGIQQRPQAKSNGFVDCSFPKVSEEQLAEVVTTPRSTEKGLLQKIQEFFKKPAYE